MRKCSLESSKTRYVYARLCKSMPRNHIENLINAYRTIVRKSMILVRGGSQNPLKWCPGDLRKPPLKQVGSATPQKCQRHVRGAPFWIRFGRPRAPFWTSLGAKGIPKSTVLVPKSRNMTSRTRHQKQFEMLIKIYSKNVNFWTGWTHRNALHISISGVLAQCCLNQEFH